MRKIINVVLLFLFIGSVHAQQSFSLEEAVQYGIQESMEMKMNALKLQKADIEIKEFRALGLPNINGKVDLQHFIDIPVNLVPAEAFGGPAGTYSELKFGTNNRLAAGVSMNQLIFDGSFFTGLKVQKVYRELVSKNVNQTKFDKRGNITKAYMNVLLVDENLKVIDKNVENLEKTIEETKSLLSNGLVEKIDVQRLELSVDNLVSQRANVVRLKKLNENLLKFQMSFPIEKEILLTQTLDDIVDKIIAEDVQLSDKVDYSKRPEYEVIEIGQRLNELKLKANKNARYPSLYGFASHEQLLQRDDLLDEDAPGFTKTSVVGASLNIPIFQGLKKNLAIQKTKLEILEADNQKSEFERAMNLQIQTSYDLFVNARNNVFIAKRQEALANDIYDVTKVKYEEGVGSSVERTQAERDLYNSQNNYMQALFNMVMAKIDLDIAKGELEQNNY